LIYDFLQECHILKFNKIHF